MLGWFGERLKCSRAALTENPLRTYPLLAFLHAKPKILIPLCCILSCLPERDLPELWTCGNTLQSSGEGVRAQKQGRGCRHKICAAPKLPQAPELDPWAAQEKNSQLCHGLLGPHSTDRQLSLPWRGFGNAAELWCPACTSKESKAQPSSPS